MPDITFLQAQSGSAINGGDVTITFSSGSSGIGSSSRLVLFIATIGTSRTPGLTIATSSGGTYLGIGTPLNSSYARSMVSVGGSSGGLIGNSFQATLTGTAGSSDSTALIGMIFDNIDWSATPTISVASTVGNSSTPDGPVRTIGSSHGAAVLAWGGQVNTTVGTPPAGFGDQQFISRNDTLDATASMSWTVWNSTSSVDPGPYLSVTTPFAWVAHTVWLDAIQDVFLYQQLNPLAEPRFRIDVVGY